MSSRKMKAPKMLKKPAGDFAEPHWALDPTPTLANVVMEVYKEEGVILKRLYIGKKRSFVFGRQKEKCAEVLEHASISRFHCALLHAAKQDAGGPKLKPIINDDGEEFDLQGLLICDLHSSHGTFVNDLQLPRGQCVLVCDNDVIRFGGSNRKYKLKGLGYNRKGELEDLIRQARQIFKDKAKADGQGSEKDRARKEEQARKEKRRREEDAEGSSKKSKAGPMVRCSHILVKHKGSRRPSSWLEDKITRSEAEAETMVLQYRQQILDGGSFSDIAKKCSHCSSAKRGGDLGKFGRKAMQKPFEDASFGMEVGMLSQPIFTESGVHIILRTQ